MRAGAAAAIALSTLFACGGGGSPPSTVLPPQGNQSYAVTVTLQGSGQGEVHSADGLLACGPACTASFSSGTQVTLMAMAAAGSTFAGWSGSCSGLASCQVTVTQAQSIAARFDLIVPPPPPADRALVVTVSGAGSVTSDPAGIDCGKTCAARFPAAAAIVLSAAPGAGFVFAGWSGACSGTGACPVAPGGDAGVSALFAPGPTPPQTAVLTVSTNGPGKVSSNSSGIDCGPAASACSAVVLKGAIIQLNATPDAGAIFAGWSGGCSGAQSCSITLSADAQVIANFTALPPPPPPPPTDECAGLVPGALPPPLSATVPDTGCAATSDDGAGDYLVRYSQGTALGAFPRGFFYALQSGALAQVGDTPEGSDTGAFDIFSQPAGFTIFGTNSDNGSSQIRSYSRGGILLSIFSITTQFQGGDYPTSAIGIDPSGGTAVAREYKRADGSYVVTYQRLDKSGAAATGEVTIGAGRTPIVAVGVALSGNVLVVRTTVGPGPHQARWLTSAGAALTDWFAVNATEASGLAFLMDGSLALYERSPDARTFVGRFFDAQPTQAALPDWLQARATQSLSVIRQGRGYAAFGAGNRCGAALEILAAGSGRSCGCVAIPALGPSASVGRDGSVMVPTDHNNTCTVQVYPQLLR